MRIDEGDIVEDKDNGDVEIHVKGKIMQKTSNTISLKSIYDLIVNIQKDLNDFKITTNKRLDNIENRLYIIENDIKELKSLPTINKELKEIKLSKK